MSLTLCGKCPPEPTELEAASDRGFENVELYLGTAHLDAIDESVAACHDADVNVASVHTPHVHVNEMDYLRATNDLAERVDADAIVAHSAFIEPRDADKVDETIDWCQPTGYETNPGYSWEYAKNAILDRGYDFTFDLAHVYIATQSNFEDAFDALLYRYGSERVPVVHVCDSTVLRDGLEFGTGDLPLDAYIHALKENYEGVVTLEVMPEHQEAALNYWQSV